MARLSRVVAPGIPHHITQRGNRRQRTFFYEDDYSYYLELMAEWCSKKKVECWAYCLMPNHVHMVLVPDDEKGLQVAVGEAHRRYTRMVNFREGWKGHLWQGRFSSFVMDEKYLIACTRYVELNPVRAGLVKSPADWKWSSAKAHIKRSNDGFVNILPLTDIIDEPWEDFLGRDIDIQKIESLKKHERTGRPAGDDNFIETLENQLDRKLKPGKPGPKKKN